MVFWRNWLARPTVNREVHSSILWRTVVFSPPIFSHFPLFILSFSALECAWTSSFSRTLIRRSSYPIYLFIHHINLPSQSISKPPLHIPHPTMAKDKEKSQNPAAAQRKLDKAKALKKSKSAIAAQRTERLATRNPHRLESQIADLHALKASSGGTLSTRDQKQLADLEKDIARVKKARETLGDKAPSFPNRGGRVSGEGARGRGDSSSRAGRGSYSGLGKRRRDHPDGARASDQDSEDTDPDVRRIPWPRDTPPPLPRHHNVPRNAHTVPTANATAANLEPVAPGRERPPPTTAAEGPPDTTIPAKPTPLVQGRRTYEGKAQVRDLKKEAARFVPGVVRRKIEAVRGRGGLIGEEEVGRLEGEGYLLGAGGGGLGVEKGEGRGGQEMEAGEGIEGGKGISGREIEEGEEARRLREEEKRFEREIGMVAGADTFVEEDDGMLGDLGKEGGGIVEDVSDEDL